MTPISIHLSATAPEGKTRQAQAGGEGPQEDHGDGGVGPADDQTGGQGVQQTFGGRLGLSGEPAADNGTQLFLKKNVGNTCLVKKNIVGPF